MGAAVEAGVPVYAGTDAGGGIEHGRIVDEVTALAGVGMAADDGDRRGLLAGQGMAGLAGPRPRAPRPTCSATATDPRTDLATLRSPSRILLRGRVIR